MMKIIIRGGGDLASGIALRLFKSHFKVVILEINQPRFVRRSVSFGNAVYERKTNVEGVAGFFVDSQQALTDFDFSIGIPVLIDPDANIQTIYRPSVLIDARMLKKYVPYDLDKRPLVLGLGPGFCGGDNCHAAIETNRGHFLGRVIWNGPAQADTGAPGIVNGQQYKRVLRAPITGTLHSEAKLGQIFKQGERICSVNEESVYAPFDGCLRGLIQTGLYVSSGEKIGDLDPRLDPKLTQFVSEKSLAIAGGVLEAILSYYKLIK
jgi:xanthine dehydrogenase accessory factor